MEQAITMDQLIAITAPLISGAVGGSLVGSLARNLSLGTFGNVLAGIVGGIGGSQIIRLLMGSGTAAVASTAAVATGGTEIGSIWTLIVSGGVGGGVVMAIVGVIKGMMAK